METAQPQANTQRSAGVAGRDKPSSDGTLAETDRPPLEPATPIAEGRSITTGQTRKGRPGGSSMSIVPDPASDSDTARRTEESGADLHRTDDRQPALIRHGRCGKSWSGKTRGHCAGCHETFTAGAFDRHQTKDGCHDPASRGLVARQEPWGTLWSQAGGYWGGGGDDDAEEDHATPGYRDVLDARPSIEGFTSTAALEWGEVRHG